MKIGIKEDYYQEIIKIINFLVTNLEKVHVQTAVQLLIHKKNVLKGQEKWVQNGLIKILLKMKSIHHNKI